MKNRWKIWVICVVIFIFGIIVYKDSQQTSSDATSKNSEPSFKKEENKVSRWYSTSPINIMDANDAETDINNIKVVQKNGWKLLMQNGQPVSFNESISGRNDIIEKSATNLLNGCYELLIDNEGTVVDVRPSEEAKKILEEQQKQAMEKQEQEFKQQQKEEHDDIKYIIQNNIADIHKYTESGYRFKVSNDENEPIVTWNINKKADKSLSLEYSIKRLTDMGITVKSDSNGKVIGFSFNQTDFHKDEFDLYGMIQ